jgi:hypothetical protein
MPPLFPLFTIPIFSQSDIPASNMASLSELLLISVSLE